MQINVISCITCYSFSDDSTNTRVVDRKVIILVYLLFSKVWYIE